MNEKQLIEALGKLEDKSKIEHSDSISGVVYRLFDYITEARQKRHTWKEITEVFVANGVKVSASTLAQSYRAAKKEREEHQHKEEEQKAKEKAAKVAAAKRQKEEERKNVMG